MDNFIREIKQYSTEDILLILQDQLDLYSEEEIRLLKEELRSRPADALEREKRERELAAEKLEQYEEEKERERKEQERLAAEENERRQKEARHAARLSKLKQSGAEGYYEYKAVSLQDESGFFRSKSGSVDISAMNEVLNELGMEGWRLVTAYSNELGKNAFSAGGSGINSTVDENILIFERFVKF